MSTSSVSSSPARGSETPRVWAARVASVQTARDPDTVARIKSNLELQKKNSEVEKSKQRVERLERSAYLSSASAMPTLRAFGGGGRAGGGFSAPAAAAAQLRHAAHITPTLRHAAKSSLAIGDEDESVDGAMDAQLDELERELAVASPGYVAFGQAVEAMPAVAPAGGVFMLGDGRSPRPSPQLSAAGAAMNAELHELLDKFKNEPTDPAELELKFKLYEDFQGTVEVVRKSALDFWAENQHLFVDVPEVKRHTEREIANIDNAANLGIQEASGKTWIIYHMTKKCHANSEMITGLLSMIKARLNLLNQDPGDCPCCLEAMTRENIHRLGCCHATCAACWEQWKALKGGQAFCPVCRSAEFVHEIVRSAEPLP